ncbi:tetratricopeptide repeat protein [Longimicrobium sp.]|uniref:tetratricopeptide repeat protein n=1 Tax=Longimicrobium sp. TaxID=2029185 RepID=UPI002C3C67A7|nr:tetratricopeptide repeat protein [Longimicrobium sp.]HSU12884.1 tetratricopeptide repeat protein [Longimicrobium sp.]
MTEERTQRRSRRISRLWVVPPGLTASDEPFEGYRVLEEAGAGLGVPLWQFLRDVDLWSTTPPEARGRLFSAGMVRRRRALLAQLGVRRELRLPLETIGQALEGRTHGAGAQITRACETLSRWAGDHAMPRTALAFAQSASLATPEQPGPAYMVGLLARRNAEYRRAETWFRRALGLARRSGDWRHYGLACLGVGNLYRQRGDYPTARAWYGRALRVARRHALWDVRPLALHDLFCVSMNGENGDTAEEWAQRAFKAYGPRHPRLVALAHDVARFWLDRRRFRPALQVFRAVLPHVSRIAERRIVVANMAAAAAGMGDRLAFAAMWGETWRLVDEYEDTEGVPEALVGIAAGAAALGDPDRAQLAAGHAATVARKRDEPEPRLAAERIIEAARSVRVRARVPPPPPAEDDAEATPEALFATELAEALTLGVDPDPGEPVAD